MKFFGLLACTVSCLTLSVTCLTASERKEPLDRDHPEVRNAIRLQSDIAPAILGLPEVLGTAVSADEDSGEVEVLILVDRGHGDRDRLSREMPRRLRGIPLRVEFTDPFVATAGKTSPAPPTTKVSHTAKQAFPIQLGTSGGWRYDAISGYCCGGTLGAAIAFNGVQYVLSNFHVLEGDTIGGKNARIASTGDYVVQPSLQDVSCNEASVQNVGTLVRLGLLSTSNTDAAVAKALTGAVRTDGAILAVGTIAATPVAASVGLAVKKSGRSTGLTRSSISGINATVTVNYLNECGGTTAFTKTFTGQILVKNSNLAFLAAGDSGALLLQDLATNPRACGLLFATSGSVALANPIDEVLSAVGKALNGGLAAKATLIGK